MGEGSSTRDETFRVALTFDAEHPDRPPGPPTSTERILDILRSEGVTSTFFVQGRWAQAEPETARRIAEDGHLIGHHSFYHARMPLLHGGGLEADVVDGQEAIRAATGVDPRPWFRCPFGTGHDDERVLSELASLGYRNVHWNVELEDWEPWRTSEAIASDAIEKVSEFGDGAVVLLHTWPRGTSGALPRLIHELRELGTDLVTIDALDGLP
jgi:peptidoglycan/xylan/chitin deacetylase (PgdA/CDA1 family)